MLGRGAVIVPLYVSSRESIRGFENALATLPTFSGRILVAVQGREDLMAEFRALPLPASIMTIESHAPLGKWPAVRRCLSKLNGDEEWIAIFDGDGAYSGMDLNCIVDPIVADGVSHTIGRRTEVFLSSVDEYSPHTRVYVEAFFNTLTLMSLKLEESATYREFDIQCGFQAFSRRRIRHISVDDLPYYGGELALFHKTVMLGQRVVNVPIKQQSATRSTYRISEIVESLFRLPFLAASDSGILARAIQLSPRLYASWIDRDSEFELEIRRVLGNRSR